MNKMMSKKAAAAVMAAFVMQIFLPLSIDLDNGIAYVSYDQVMGEWDTAYGTLAHVKIENIKDIGFIGVRLLDIPEKPAEMTIEDYIEIVNGISTDEDVITLTEEQMGAVERVLEYDYKA